MPIYAITYDLNKEKDYKSLWEELDRLKGKKAAKSFYLLNLTDDSAQDVIDHFKNFIDKDDTFIVVKTTIKNIQVFRPLLGTSDWINSNAA